MKRLWHYLSLSDMTPGARRGLLYVLVLGILAYGGSYYQSTQAVNHLRDTIHAQCKFLADIGSAPITVNPATHKASLLGVSLISDSRTAWRGLGCTGQLAKPSSSFVHWARVYHLPAN